MQNLPDVFSYDFEQYYLMVDPGIQVLLETTYHYEDRTIRMPVAWVKNWGKGRVNYGPLLHDRKGITHGVRFNNQFLFHWEIIPFGPEFPQGFLWRNPAMGNGVPMLHRAEHFLSEPADTWLQIDRGVHGIVWVNGFCLGRYWNIGPQQTLCLSAPLLHRGYNTFEFLELESVEIQDVVLCSQPFPNNNAISENASPDNQPSHMLCSLSSAG